MIYLVNSFKHKWILYALSVLVASVAAHESIRLLLLLLVIIFWCFYKRFTIVHCIFILFIGIVSYFYFSFMLTNINKPLELPITLTWTDEFKIDGAMLRGFMEDHNGRIIYVTYKFKSENEKKRFEAFPLVGKRFEVTGVLEEPHLPAHEYAFNMGGYLKSKGALGVLNITEWSFVDTISNLKQKISVQRFYLTKHIEETFPDSLFAEAQSLLIGFQENVDSETTRAYQKLGITHLFAISGLHIAMLSLLLFQGLLRIGIRKELATNILIVALPIYAIIAGGAPSVWRAVLVVEIILISQMKRKLAIDDALAISLIFFVYMEPWAIYQIGFQLSYLATLSLIYTGKLFARYRSWLVQSFLITFVCQLIVYPLLLFHFYEISLSSFIVNILFVPLFSFIILPINLTLLLVSYLPGNIVSVLFLIYEPIRGSISRFIMWLQSIPNQMWIPGKPSVLLMIVAFLSVFYFFYLFNNRSRFWKSCLVLVIPILLLQFQTKWFHTMKISFISVGQGDSVLIELPFREETYLIDTGGILRFEQEEWKKTKDSYEIGRQIVVPYLKGKGIHTIDKLIITHADSDHVEGAEEILKEIAVKEIHITPNSYQKEIMIELIEEARERKIPIREQKEGYYWTCHHYTFQYVWPTDLVYEGNNDSLVLYVTDGNFQALLTGDLEEVGERKIITLFPQLQNIDLLKAGHHGSKTSSSQSFIEKLKPRLTIFSTGRNNRYGHPSHEVVERYESLGLKTLNTAEVGTIEVTIFNNEIRVSKSNSLFK